jgi:hypothetical protein
MRPRAFDAALLYDSYARWTGNLLARGWKELPKIESCAEWKALVKCLHSKRDVDCSPDRHQLISIAEANETIGDDEVFPHSSFVSE